jgi:outer membrane protein OmpA-like peptidoglycan-associated protein
MPLSADDVISVLLDQVPQRIDFYVDSIHVSGDQYRKVAQLIVDEQILVAAGDDPNRAEYNPVSDTITTQRADAPLDLTKRGVLLHESTHAIADMDYATVTWHTNEACAYIAECLYLLLSSPTQEPRAFNYHFAKDVVFPWIRQQGLDKRPGEGLHFRQDDVMPLIRELNSGKYPAYHTNSAIVQKLNGISKKKRSIDARDMPGLDIPAGVDEPSIRSALPAQLGYRSPVNVLFDFQRYDLNFAAKTALEQIAGFIKARKGPANKVYLTGYTDSVGDESDNLRLSRLRAEAVRDWLVKVAKLVGASEVVPLGKGWAEPVAPNRRPDGGDNPAGRAENRRVEVLIQ